MRLRVKRAPQRLHFVPQSEASECSVRLKAATLLFQEKRGQRPSATSACGLELLVKRVKRQDIQGESTMGSVGVVYY